ncbi:MAG: hypothetical protein P4L59_10140 [Desulfosporosinus sp.]|nr:hypothetical protein [Desulfosporosinus sp.]
MHISGKSIRNVDKYLWDFEEGEKFHVGFKASAKHFPELILYGFSTDTSEAQAIIPRPLRKITSFNANGCWRVDKTLPREARTFEMEYHCVDWHGDDHYGTCYHTRQCYQRRLLPPLSVELTLSTGLLVSPTLVYTQNQKNLIKHIINMFLEMFGECETLSIECISKNSTTTKKLPWTVLPKGKYPWEKAKEHLDLVMDAVPERQKVVISNRHECIAGYIPDFLAYGDQGFWGYVVYGFTGKDIFVFESNRPDNATYIFRGIWEEASKLSKAEILGNNLHEARIIHTGNWRRDISLILK